MSAKNYEDKLKSWTKEIIDECLLSLTHELEKRIAVVAQKNHDLKNRVALYENSFATYREHHAKHKTKIDRKDASVQTLIIPRSE